MGTKINCTTVYQNLSRQKATVLAFHGEAKESSKGMRAMFRKISTIAIGLMMVVAIVAIVCAPPAYAANRIQRMTNNSTDDKDPSLYNGTIAWSGWDGHDYEIYYWNGTTTQQMTDNFYDDTSPSLYNGTIAWAGYTNYNDSRINYWNGSSVIQVPNPPSMGDARSYNPSLYDGKIAWETEHDDEHLISYWDGGYSTTTLDPVHISYGARYHPSVYNGTVAFSLGNDIWYWDGSVYNLITPGILTGAEPSLYDGEVVYATSEIFRWGGFDNNRITRLTYSSGPDYDPSFHNGGIAWVAAEAWNSPGEICYLAAGSNVIQQITNNSTSDGAVSLFNGTMAWMNYDGNDWEIYYYGPLANRDFSGTSGNTAEVGIGNFYDSSYNAAEGTVETGNFHNSSHNDGVISGDATFSDSSYNIGTIQGNAIFNGLSWNEGIVQGNATFNDSSENRGTIYGNGEFWNYSKNYGPIYGNVTLYGHHYIMGNVSGAILTGIGSNISGKIFCSILKGNGRLSNATIDISSGHIIAPGFSPGNLTVSGGTATWSGGGTYEWQLYNTGLAAGIGWDLITLTDNALLEILATPLFKFNIDIEGLSHIEPDVVGNPIGFDPLQNYSWMILDGTDGAAITTFSTDKFAISVNGISGVNASNFSLSMQDNNIMLNYTTSGPSTVPEPATVFTILGGLVMAGYRRVFKRVKKG
jgi:hypothetical protein